MTTSSPRPVPPPTEEELQRMSLMEHLEELRKRIVWSVLFFAVAFWPCWAYYREIFRFLMVPLHKVAPTMKLSYLALSDPFILYFKMAALAAVFVSSPLKVVFGAFGSVGSAFGSCARPSPWRSTLTLWHAPHSWLDWMGSFQKLPSPLPMSWMR